MYGAIVIEIQRPVAAGIGVISPIPADTPLLFVFVQPNFINHNQTLSILFRFNIHFDLGA